MSGPAPIFEPETAEVEKRRVKVLMVNPIEFMMLFEKGLEFRRHTKILEGVPADAQMIGVAYDTRRDFIMMVIESKEFDEIPATEPPPPLLIKIKVGTDGGTKKKASKRKK